MNRRHTSRLQKFLRRTALIVALICLGVSGGTTLVHTDDIGPLMRFHAGASTFSHADAAGGPDMCLACQWENSLFNPQVPAVPVPHLPLTPLPLLAAAAPAYVPHPFDHTSPRAPPRTLS